MRYLILSIVAIIGMSACSSSCANKDAEANTASYAVFGDSTIVATDAIDKSMMLTKFESMNDGDSLDVKFKTTINEVCQAKGCWMKLQLDDDTETVVKFKDYAFFVPKNAAGQETIVEGKAYKTVTSVAELKHLAEDAGKSKEEIDAIKEPKEQYTFMASGVLIDEGAE